MHTATSVHNGVVGAYGQQCDKPYTFLNLILPVTVTFLSRLYTENMHVVINHMASRV